MLFMDLSSPINPLQESRDVSLNRVTSGKRSLSVIEHVRLSLELLWGLFILSPAT